MLKGPRTPPRPSATASKIAWCSGATCCLVVIGVTLGMRIGSFLRRLPGFYKTADLCVPRPSALECGARIDRHAPYARPRRCRDTRCRPGRDRYGFIVADQADTGARRRLPDAHAARASGVRPAGGGGNSVLGHRAAEGRSGRPDGAGRRRFPMPTPADKLPIAKMKVPPGFKVEVYAGGHPRRARPAPGRQGHGVRQLAVRGRQDLRDRRQGRQARSEDHRREARSCPTASSSTRARSTSRRRRTSPATTAIEDNLDKPAEAGDGLRPAPGRRPARLEVHQDRARRQALRAGRRALQHLRVRTRTSTRRSSA